MMNWNNNDTKYIIKRIILYLLITGIVFFAGSKCAKANVISSQFSNIGTSDIGIVMVSGKKGTIQFKQTVFQNAGEGYVIFNLFVWPDSNHPYNDELYGISVGNGTNIYQCEMSTQIWYSDNSTQLQAISLKCPVNLTNGNGLSYWIYEKGVTGELGIKTSDLITFVSTNDEAQQITNAINSQIQAQINAGNINAQNISNAVSTATQQEINAINNAQFQAHQDAQNIINGLQQATSTEQATQDYLKEDYQFDQQMINDFGIFGTNTNYLQQILMWPYNLALSLGTALSGTSCSSYSFGYLYGTELKLPCINWKQYVGNTIYVAIDTIMGMCILFGVISFIRKAFEYVLNFGNNAYDTISVEVFK